MGGTVFAMTTGLFDLFSGRHGLYPHNYDCVTCSHCASSRLACIIDLPTSYKLQFYPTAIFLYTVLKSDKAAYS